MKSSRREYGDLNQDGIFSILDFYFLLRFISCDFKLINLQDYLADLNNVHITDIFDLIKISINLI